MAWMPRAIVFDFDGVIVNTEPLHHRAFAGLLAKMSIAVTLDEFLSKYAGLNDRAFLQRLFEQLGFVADARIIDRVLRAKNDVYQRLIAGGCPLLPGVVGFVNEAARRWPLAICSGARRVEIETILRHAELLAQFPTIVSVDEAPTSKPDPAGYLRTLAQLQQRAAGLKAGDCLAIEDSVHGIAAAKAAGMKVLAVQTMHTAAELSQADAIVPDLRSATADSVMAI